MCVCTEYWITYRIIIIHILVENDFNRKCGSRQWCPAIKIYYWLACCWCAWLCRCIFCHTWFGTAKLKMWAQNYIHDPIQCIGALVFIKCNFVCAQHTHADAPVRTRLAHHRTLHTFITPLKYYLYTYIGSAHRPYFRSKYINR